MFKAASKTVTAKTAGSVDSVGSSIDGIGSSSGGAHSSSDGGNGEKQAAKTTVCFGSLKTSENLVISLKCAIAIYLCTRKQNQHRCLTSHLVRSLVRHLGNNGFAAA